MNLNPFDYNLHNPNEQPQAGNFGNQIHMALAENSNILPAPQQRVLTSSQGTDDYAIHGLDSDMIYRMISNRHTGSTMASATHRDVLPEDPANIRLPPIVPDSAKGETSSPNTENLHNPHEEDQVRDGTENQANVQRSERPEETSCSMPAESSVHEASTNLTLSGGEIIDQVSNDGNLNDLPVREPRAKANQIKGEQNSLVAKRS